MRFFLIILCLLVTLQAKAQRTAFEAGYIVIKSDTIKGLILKTDEVKLGQEVQFKTSESTKVTTYIPGDIQSFSFLKEGFIFKTVELALKQDTLVKKTNRFAKLLLKGYTTLYKLQLGDNELEAIYETENKHVYILQKNNVFYTLGQYESMIDPQHYRLNKQYHGFLISLTSDCSSIKIPEDLEFTDSQIIGVVKNYNNCIEPNTSTSYSYKVKLIKKHGLTVSYGSLVNFYYANSFSNSNATSVGYFWDITDPARSKNSSFLTGLNYMYLSYSVPINQFASEKRQEHYLKIPLLFQRNFYNKTNTLPFINFGLTVQASTNNELSYVDMVPFVDFAAGAYINKFRLSVSLENSGFSIKSNKLLNFSVGYRLDHIK